MFAISEGIEPPAFATTTEMIRRLRYRMLAGLVDRTPSQTPPGTQTSSLPAEMPYSPARSQHRPTPGKRALDTTLADDYSGDTNIALKRLPSIAAKVVALTHAARITEDSPPARQTADPQDRATEHSPTARKSAAAKKIPFAERDASNVIHVQRPSPSPPKPTSTQPSPSRLSRSTRIRVSTPTKRTIADAYNPLPVVSAEDPVSSSDNAGKRRAVQSTATDPTPPNKRAVPCTACGVVLADRKSYKRHMRTVHTKRSFVYNFPRCDDAAYLNADQLH